MVAGIYLLGNHGPFGFQDLLSEHECAQASETFLAPSESGRPQGCYKETSGSWAFNPIPSQDTIDNHWMVSEMFCKQ